MDNPLFGVPRSLRFAAGPAQFADGDGDGNGDDSSSGGQGSSGTTDVAPHLDPSSLVQEHGDARQALGALSQKVDSVESDNADLREERRELREKVPDDGSVVVSADTVEQLREDGFLDTDEPTEEDLVGALQEEREARVTLENKQRFEEVVNVTGANRGVLKDIGADTLNYEVEKETNDDGDTVKTAYVKTEDGRTEFTQFVKNEYPTLAETILDGDGGSSSSTTYPDQPGGGGDQGGGDDSPVTDTDSYIEKLNKERGRGDGDG